jgi:peptidyl-prolyl cis-trans isomerase SurA
MKFLRALLIAAVLLAPVHGLRAELVNGIQAIVHDSVITYEDVEILTAQTASVLTRQYGNDPDMFRQKMSDARADNLDKLLKQELILHDFKTAGYNLPESILDEEVERRIRSRYGDRMTATKTLQAEGITLEKFRQRIRDQIIVEALTQKNISSEIIISPYKVETYYGAHTNEFKVEDEVKLRMIVLTNAPTAHKMAEEILAKLQEGVSFSEMASIYSEGSHRKEGGDFGWFEKSMLRKELGDIAFSLKPGQHSGIIEVPQGIYLMQVDETRPAHVRGLADVRDQIEKNLLLDEQKRLEKQWIDKLRKKTFVRTFF